MVSQESYKRCDKVTLVLGISLSIVAIGMMITGGIFMSLNGNKSLNNIGFILLIVGGSIEVVSLILTVTNLCVIRKYKKVVEQNRVDAEHKINVEQNKTEIDQDGIVEL